MSYFAKHNVKGLLEHMTTKLIEHRPSNVLEFLVNYLDRRIVAREQALNCAFKDIGGPVCVDKWMPTEHEGISKVLADSRVLGAACANIPGPQSHVASATIALRRAIAVEKKYPGPNQSKLIASLSGFVNRNYDLLLNEPAPPSTHCRTCTIHLEARAMKCSRCLQVNYCSKECQKAHWKRGHKGECS